MGTYIKQKLIEMLSLHKGLKMVQYHRMAMKKDRINMI